MSMIDIHVELLDEGARLDAVADQTVVRLVSKGWDDRFSRMVATYQNERTGDFLFLLYGLGSDGNQLQYPHAAYRLRMADLSHALCSRHGLIV